MRIFCISTCIIIYLKAFKKIREFRKQAQSSTNQSENPEIGIVLQTIPMVIVNLVYIEI